MKWQMTTFSDLFLQQSKNGVNRPTRVRGEGVKMVNMGELFAYDWIADQDMERVPLNDRESEVYLLQEGDLLFARQSLVLEGAGKCSVVKTVNEPTTFEGHIIRIRLNPDEADPFFYFYYFRSPLSPMRAIVQQCAQAGIRATDLAKLKVVCPPINKQRRVTKLLSAYDSLIENNRRRIQLLEQSARMLYKEWFVHLRFPGHEHVKINKGVPEGWERVSVPEIIDIDPTESIPRGTELWYVPMSSLSETGMTVDTGDFELRTEHTSTKFRNGDTLFARITPCLENGKTAFVYFLKDDEVACGSTEFIVLRGKRVSPYFTYCLSRTHAFRGNAIKSMIGSSGRQRVQVSCFNEFYLGLPQATLSSEFDNNVRPCFDQIRNLEVQNQQLLQARDILLPKLMSGEVEVNLRKRKILKEKKDASQ